MPLWSHQAYLKASNGEADDNMGGSVAVSSGDIVIVGASGEDSGTTGIDGDGGDNSAGLSGAAYAFGPILGPISPVAKLPSGMHLEIPGLPWRTLGVEYSPDLSPGSWLDIGDFTQAAGLGTFVDGDPSRCARPEAFYRALRPVREFGTACQ